MKTLIYANILLCVVIASCATTDRTIGHAEEEMIPNVRFFPQENYQCGPASLATVLNYWGLNISPEEIAGEIYSKEAGGTLNMDMLLYAERLGMRASQYKGGLADLKAQIRKLLPVIVLVDNGFSIYKINHFMVVVGIRGDDIIVNSGREKEKVISGKDFLRAWEKTGFWTLLIKKE